MEIEIPSFVYAEKTSEDMEIEEEDEPMEDNTNSPKVSDSEEINDHPTNCEEIELPIENISEIDVNTQELDSAPDGSPTSLVRQAFDGRKYRTLRDLVERTKLSKKCVREVLSRIGKIKRRKWRISTFYLLAFDSEEFGQQLPSKIKPVSGI
ncbi:hypothetical protein KR038_009122 [Drosophila bunnanda]|nr:hypothetical protein KR038_009122 [Drosophila bunnanda]